MPFAATLLVRLRSAQLSIRFVRPGLSTPTCSSRSTVQPMQPDQTCHEHTRRQILGTPTTVLRSAHPVQLLTIGATTITAPAVCVSRRVFASRIHSSPSINAAALHLSGNGGFVSVMLHARGLGTALLPRLGAGVLRMRLSRELPQLVFRGAKGRMLFAPWRGLDAELGWVLPHCRLAPI